MPPDRPPEPWDSFLLEIDETFNCAIELHCIGGFAMAMLYGLPRPTVDIDYIEVVPVHETARLQAFAGEGSAVHRKHGVYMQHVGVVSVPEDYLIRITPMYPPAYRGLRLFGLEGHDLAMSKLERNSARDREDLKYLARVVPLDLGLLERRYRSELRPYLAHEERHDLTMRLWIEMLSEARGL
jgi:Nucleotidyltransferase of unknown function (DUF6036)